MFAASLAHMHKAGELLPSNEICHLRVGWACQFHALSNGSRAIVHVYLPGDVIGLDTFLCTRRFEEISALTAVTIETVDPLDAQSSLMANRPIALYVAWLLGQRQRRADRLVAAISCLDAPGRMALMVLDFYKRLRRRKLITGSTYNLPMSQVQIGHYLGLTVVHINRVLRLLRDARIFSLEKHSVTILDLERLTSLAQNGGTAISPGVRPFTEIALQADRTALGPARDQRLNNAGREKGGGDPPLA